MIAVGVVVNKDGCLTGCEARGHADFASSGSDPLCAAATVLLRTAAETLASRPGIKLEWEAPDRGVFWFRVVPADPVSGEKDWERGVADFLVGGLTRLGREYPDHITVKIQHK